MTHGQLRAILKWIKEKQFVAVWFELRLYF